MIKLLIKWMLFSALVYVLPYIIPDIVVSAFGWALLAALVLGLINMLIKPVVKLLTLPVNLLTLGIFGVIVNALLFWGASVVVPGFDVNTFIGALLGSIVVSLGRWIIDELV